MDNTYLLIILIPSVLVGFWCIVLFITSKIGWYRVAKNYAQPWDDSIEKVGIASARINSMNYNNVIHLHCNKSGIQMRMMKLFSIFHKPVFIPWSEIKGIREDSFLFMKYHSMEIGERKVRVQIDSKTFEKCLEYRKSY